MEDKKIKQKVVNRLLGKKKIYNIVIEGHDEEQVREMFEEIQNKYSLYDNCVFEEADIEDTIIDYDEERYAETGRLSCMNKKENDKVNKATR